MAALFAGVLAVGLLGAGAANAALMVQVESDGITKNFTDNGVGDLTGETGRLTTITTNIGNFSFVLAVATSKPIIGTASQPHLDLSFNVLSSGNGGTLIVRYTDTDFVMSGPSSANCRVGGVTEGTVDYSCYYDDSNTPFGTATTIATLETFSGGAFSGSKGGSFDAAAPQSFTDVLTISHGKGTKITTGNANVVVPEPGSLALFGLGLLGLGFLWRRRSLSELAA